MFLHAVSCRALFHRMLLVGAIVALVGVVPIGPAHAALAGVDGPTGDGLVLPPLNGLLPGLPGGMCAGLFEIVGVSPSRCTHGPDSAAMSSDANAATTRDPLIGSSGHALCYGDGQDGNRIELIYASVPGTRDRFSSVVNSIRTLAGNVDNVMAVSAAKTGGERHFRFVTDTSCAPVLHDVALSASGGRSFGATINDLIAQGFNRTDRQYLVLADTNVYCGIATVDGDDQPYIDNSSNTGPGYARLDNHCWGTGAAAHELMHLLGAVQLDAPHSTGHYHCTDTPDAMCYADSSDVKMVQECPSSDAGMYDCNNDDYFNTSPPAGSYLAAHWDTADNQFLETQPGSDTSPGPPIAPPRAPHRTVVHEFSGSLGPTNHMEILPVDVYDGPLAVHLDSSGFGGAGLRLEDASGVEFAAWAGPSPQDHYAIVSRGTYRLVLTGDGPLNFQGTIRYVAP